jgi:hypothetical protein
MSRTVRSRREALDNIAVGSAISSRERTIAGALPPTDATKDNISVGGAWGSENVIVAGTDLLAGERLG